METRQESGVCHSQGGAMLCYLAQTPMPQAEKLRHSGSYSGPAPHLFQRLRQRDIKFRTCLGQPEQLYETLSQKEGWGCSSMVEDWFGLGVVFCSSPVPLTKETLAEACRVEGKDSHEPQSGAEEKLWLPQYLGSS